MAIDAMSSFGAVTPILRIFDDSKARDFYLGYLGFAADWEHRFADGMPLYMQVSRGAALLHLSEHHGDCSPGGAVRIETAGIDAYLRELQSKGYRFLNPEIEHMPSGLREMKLTDPFGNRLIFFSNA